MSKTIFVIIGTTRQNRASEGIAKWVMNTLPQTKNITFELVDLRNWPLPFFDEPQSPTTSKGEYQNEAARAWLEKIKSADGYLLITGEYNHGIPAVLKNAMDYWYFGYTKNKPVSFISYGAGAGGVRAVEHLRQVSSELRLIPLHNEVNIPNVWDAFQEDGTIKHAGLVDKLASLANELDQWFDFIK